MSSAGGKMAYASGWLRQIFMLHTGKMDGQGGENVKRVYKQILLAACLGILLPAAALKLAFLAEKQETALEQTEQTIPVATAAAPQEEEASLTISVLMDDGTITTMDMDDYLTGVVLAEMPADFEVEAKKAQAVVARTYALRLQQSGTKHPSSSVCTDPNCCQSYVSSESYLANGGAQEAVEQAQQAVAETHNLVLIYDGKLIEATYFSCSGGRTEDAVAVWGSDVPYLRATDSPGEEGAVHFTDTVQFTAEEFASAIGASLFGAPASWLGAVTYTDGGGVDSMVIGGVTYKGTTLRQCLGLRSTAFTMTAVGNSIVITTKGFGHRVGMSQYGADAMAVQGSSYAEILAHYYQDTALAVYPIDKAGDLR